MRALADEQAVADHVAGVLVEGMLDGSAWPLGLATGRTMEPVYAALVRRVAALEQHQQQGLRQRWLSFNLDEYVGLGAADPGSFHAAMHRHLLEPLQLPPSRLRLPEGLAVDPHAEAERYGAALGAAGGIGLQLLGLGLNGHVGFNEPPAAAESRCHCLHLSAATRRQNAAAFGGDPAAVPARAITLGLAEILAARRILLVVTGAAKAPVLRALLRQRATAELPASWLQGHPQVEVIADRAALALALAEQPA
ncbi:MAG: glucosamine-6-phosphate deaminase [Cyanobium sp.]